MHLFFCLLLVLAASLLANADVVFFTRSEAPDGWEMRGEAPADVRITFMLALKQQNLDRLDSIFWEVSNPQHENYRQHLTIDEINAIVAPKTEHLDAVLHWLRHGGVDDNQIDSLGDALEVEATVDTVESLFTTQMYYFYNEQTGMTIIRQYGSMSVPSDVREAVDLISGLSTFPFPHLGSHSISMADIAASDSSSSSSVDMGIVPQTLYAQYNITKVQVAGSAASTTSQGVIQFTQNYFDPSDLSTYSSRTGINIAAVASSQIVGPNSTPGTEEATLDIQLQSSVNTEASQWFWLESGNNWLYSFAIHFFNTSVVPQVISISYGWYEGHICDENPTECSTLGVDAHTYDFRTNTEFQKIAARGVTIIAASGDAGAHSRSDETCISSTLRVEFPASSPYVTAVGGTQFTNSVALSTQPTICSSASPVITCASTGTEVAATLAVSQYSSGGGFSEIFPVPSWQASAVSGYLNSGVVLPSASQFNGSNRAIPDVSAVGHNNLIYLDGTITAISGTSASAPIFAGIVSLLNEYSLAHSGKTLGFLNPLLYQMAAAQPNTFNDVTVGDNKCTEYICSCQGYLAATGWDPVTGLGTPNYGNMLSYLQSISG